MERLGTVQRFGTEAVMRISEETLENFTITYPLDRLAPLERVLFLDIETTGFTAKSSYLSLIGCAYLLGGNWDT